MFPDSDIVKKFTLGKTKCSYIINYGIAPYFKEILLKAINHSPYYSLSFDESMQNCRMDVGIRYCKGSLDNDVFFIGKHVIFVHFLCNNVFRKNNMSWKNLILSWKNA